MTFHSFNRLSEQTSTEKGPETTSTEKGPETTTTGETEVERLRRERRERRERERAEAEKNADVSHLQSNNGYSTHGKQRHLA